MEFDDNRCLKTWATQEKCDEVLKHIAEKVGWTFEPENYDHYSSVLRLPRIDYDTPVHEFRLWYYPGANAFIFNCTTYTYENGFKNESIRCNNYTIGKIIKIMFDFDKQARKLEMEDRKKAISDAAQLYEA